MAQYKVPQDVEADDKLLGPFTFRQFVYLLIAGGLIALTIGLFNIFPMLAIVPIPFIVLFLALALPIKKDQPMETYLAALISYYLKPHTRLWTPGQRDTAIQITAPKVAEDSRTRNISGEEANHRLSFLADIVDTGGYAIKGTENIPIREDLIAEANMATDMFDNYKFNELNNVIQKDEAARHAKAVQGMQEAIDSVGDDMLSGAEFAARRYEEAPTDIIAQGSITSGVPSEMGPETPVTVNSPWVISDQKYNSTVVVDPNSSQDTKAVSPSPSESKNDIPKKPKSSIIELANNPDYSIETIAKEAKRINEREGEVFISLH